MTIDELPEKYKQYVMVLSNKSEYQVSGRQKKAIVDSTYAFAELPNGSTINKAFIVEFKLDYRATKDFFEENKDRIIKQLEEGKNQIIKQDNTK